MSRTRSLFALATLLTVCIPLTKVSLAGLRLTQEALVRRDAADESLRARVLLSASELACNLGRLSEAQRHAEESLAMFRRLRHPGTCSALTNLGMIAIARGDRSGARRLLERCVRLARRRGEEQLAGAAVNGLAELSRIELDFSRARALFDVCLQGHRQSGSSEAISGSLLKAGNGGT